MRAPTNPKDEFLIALRDLIQREPLLTRTLRVCRHSSVYVSGEVDSNIYYIESGQVKLVFYTPEGRECGLAIRVAQDIFGELCLSGRGPRIETALVMQDACLRVLSVHKLLQILKGESLLENLVRYLAFCMALEQEHIALLLSANSEILLANMLIHLGSALGSNDSRSKTTIPRILLEDLAAMVGTTRSRVGFFLKKFRERNLVDVNEDRSLTFEAEMLRQFARQHWLAHTAKGERYEEGLTGEFSSASS